MIYQTLYTTVCLHKKTFGSWTHAGSPLHVTVFTLYLSLQCWGHSENNSVTFHYKNHHFWGEESTWKHHSFKVTTQAHSHPSSFTISVEKIGINTVCMECSIWSLTVQIGRKAISARKWEGSDLWKPSEIILICQSERKSEIRKSGSQVKRHKEVRCSPRGEGEEVKERVMSPRACPAFRLLVNERGRCGVGNRLLLKKHTWVMKEKEGVRERKQVWLRKIESGWVREGEGGKRQCNGKRTSDFFFHLVQLGKIPILPQSEH